VVGSFQKRLESEMADVRMTIGRIRKCAMGANKMIEKDLSANIASVKARRNELLREHNNKFLLVFGAEAVDSLDPYEKAAAEGVRL